jgi:hypothetical protein
LALVPESGDRFSEKDMRAKKAADQTIIARDRQCALLARGSGAALWRHSMASAWLSGAAGACQIEPSFDLVGIQSYKPPTEQL